MDTLCAGSFATACTSTSQALGASAEGSPSRHSRRPKCLNYSQKGPAYQGASGVPQDFGLQRHCGLHGLQAETFQILPSLFWRSAAVHTCTSFTASKDQTDGNRSAARLFTPEGLVRRCQANERLVGSAYNGEVGGYTVCLGYKFEV